MCAWIIIIILLAKSFLLIIYIFSETHRRSFKRRLNNACDNSIFRISCDLSLSLLFCVRRYRSLVFQRAVLRLLTQVVFENICIHNIFKKLQKNEKKLKKDKKRNGSNFNADFLSIKYLYFVLFFFFLILSIDPEKLSYLVNYYLVMCRLKIVIT